MRIDWTNVGKEYNGTEELRDKLLRYTSAVDYATEPIGGQFGCWLKLPQPHEPPLSLGMMQGMGIKSAIKEYKIPRVSHVAVSVNCAPMGLYGIRGHYDGGKQKVEIWFIDDGVSLTPVMSKVYAKEQKEVTA